MNDDLRPYIHNNMDMKETDELVQIWTSNNRLEWSDTAFEVISEILVQRLGQLPPQNEPITEYGAHSNSESDDNLLEEDLADEENEPVLYDPEKVLLFCTWLNRAALIAVVATIILSYQVLDIWHTTLMALAGGDPEWDLTTSILALIPWAISIFIECVLIYFPLRGLAYVLKILVEMEQRSRGLEIVDVPLDLW